MYIATLLLPLTLLLPSPSSQPSKNMMGAQQSLTRGAALTIAASEEVTLDQIASTPAQYAGRQVRVRGTVATVCRVKGCWMGIRGEQAKNTARVTFKGYSFFAPFDAVGTHVSLEGEVKVKTMSLAERKHLAEDAQSDLSAIPEVELRIQASGVEFRRATP